MPRPDNSPESVGLPPITFLYTLDQVASMVNMDLETFTLTYVWYHNRSTGVRYPRNMVARNLAEPHETPDWRIAQAEFIRWLKYMGFKVTKFGTVT